MPLNIVTRSEWNARAPDPGPFPLTSWANRAGFVVHYSAANKLQTVRQIQNYQMDSNGWRDVGYNFLVDYRGLAYEGCQGTWNAVGAHVAGHNTANIGVCAIGTNSDITEVQMRTIRELYDEANRRAGKSLEKRYHSGVSGAATSCPGNRLRAWVQAGMPVTEEEMAALEGIDAKRLWATDSRISAALVSGATSHPTGWSDKKPDGTEAIWITTFLKQMNDRLVLLEEKLNVIPALIANVDEATEERLKARFDELSSALSGMKVLLQEHASGQIDAGEVVRRMGVLLSSIPSN